MEKKTAFLFLGGLIASIFGVFLSCRLSKDPRDLSSTEKTPSTKSEVLETFSITNNNERAESFSLPKKTTDTAGSLAPGTQPKSASITHYDGKALDDKVREQAQRLGVDPTTYRLPVREDPDRTKIYRMLGMHVIVNPDGEEVYIPDEL